MKRLSFSDKRAALRKCYGTPKAFKTETESEKINGKVGKPEKI